MRVTIVGCSGSYPGPDSPASCYLVEAEDREGRTWRIVLDLGNGALGFLQRHTDPLDVDALLLSHHHPDHCGDVNGYYVMRKYHPTRRVDRLPVFGPADTSARMCDSYGLPDGRGMEEAFDFHAYPGESFGIGPFEVAPVRVDHPVEAYGLRITADGSTLAYTGDTAPCDALESLAAGADLLLAEASFRDADDNPPGVHLTGADAGRTASRGEVGRLVLTHVPPWYEPEGMLAEAVAVYDGETELAVPGAIYEV